MKIQKMQNISGVIVTPENIRELANKINYEYEKDFKLTKEEKRDYLILSFILKSVDGTQYESNDMSIFSKEGFLSTRKIQAIEIQYYNPYMNKKISIRLYHTQTEDDWNEIRISSEDENWTNGVLTAIKDIITNWEKQKTWFNKYFFFLLIIFGVGIGLFFLNVTMLFVRLIYNVTNITTTEEILEWLKKLSPYIKILVYILYIKFGFDRAVELIDKIRDLYPNVEFLIGPEHLQSESQKRKKLCKLLTIGILPLIISLIIELIKML